VREGERDSNCQANNRGRGVCVCAVCLHSPITIYNLPARLGYKPNQSNACRCKRMDCTIECTVLSSPSISLYRFLPTCIAHSRGVLWMNSWQIHSYHSCQLPSLLKSTISLTADAVPRRWPAKTFPCLIPCLPWQAGQSLTSGPLHPLSTSTIAAGRARPPRPVTHLLGAAHA
jgi:hypothetical protein